MKIEILFHGELNANLFYKMLMNSAQFYSENLEQLCNYFLWGHVKESSDNICNKFEMYNIIKGSLFYDETLKITIARCNPGEANDSVRIAIRGHQYHFLLTNISSRFVWTTHLLKEYEHTR